MKKLLFILCCFLASTATFAQTTLEYNLKQGQMFMIKQEAEQMITQELDGASHVLTNLIDGLLQFKVVEINENGYAIELSFEDLNMTMNSSIQGEIMNVRAKEVSEDDMQSKMFNSLLGNPVNIILSKNGKIIEVSGGDKLVDNMVANAGIEDEFTLNMMKKSLEKEFGSEALSNSYEQMTYIYSNDAVTIGDSWQNEFAGKLNAKNTWTLNELTNANASISGLADVIMKIEEPALTMNLTGSQSSTVITDITTGFIIKMTVEGESKGSSTMVQMADQKIPTTIKSTITYELIKE
ncbi:DUF6263 family protein [Aurantibacter sp.]|uniref:DUF6263 family protein n=1 Tax=Aurantibacter sp. TaxID=2807103 RepID=UPI003264229A